MRKDPRMSFTLIKEMGSRKVQTYQILRPNLSTHLLYIDSLLLTLHYMRGRIAEIPVCARPATRRLMSKVPSYV